MDGNIKSKNRIIAEEIVEIMMGLLFKYTTGSSHSTFFGNATITSVFLCNNLFQKLSNNHFDISNAEHKIILITIVSHFTQLFLAYQRAQENRWDEQPSLAEMSFSLIAATGPAIITYFQQRRNVRRDAEINNPETPVNHNIDNQTTTIKYKKDL